MEVEVNMLGVIVAAAVSMVVGATWYSSAMFGKTWLKLENINEKVMQRDGTKAMAGMAVLALVMAYVLAHITYVSNAFYTDVSYLNSALTTGFWVWLGFVLPVTASNSLFNQAPWKITFIHAGNWLVTLLGMGLAIGLIGT